MNQHPDIDFSKKSRSDVEITKATKPEEFEKLNKQNVIKIVKEKISNGAELQQVDNSRQEEFLKVLIYFQSFI